MIVAPTRKPIPADVKRYFKFAANEPNKICPYCGSSLNGIYHIGHVIPVSSYGDHQETRILVAIHPECNCELGTNILNLEKYNKDCLVICKI